MTQEKRQLQEQIATHIYRGPASSTPHPAGERRLAGETGTREMRPAPAIRARQRVVTKPDSVQPAAGERYVERRNRVYSARAKAQPYSNVMPRTLAQTGVPASGRQMGAVKRPLPRYPQRVGIVTSLTGAALHDVLHVIERRHPGLELVLAACRVQGMGAGEEIASA